MNMEEAVLWGEILDIAFDLEQKIARLSDLCKEIEDNRAIKAFCTAQKNAPNFPEHLFGTRKK